VDPLDLVGRHLVVGSVVKLRRPRARVRRDLLGLLEGAAALEVDGDARGAERVSAHAGGQIGLLGTALDHPEHSDAGEALFGEPLQIFGDAAEAGSAALGSTPSAWIAIARTPG
jgi:hypothetical protein